MTEPTDGTTGTQAPPVAGPPVEVPPSSTGMPADTPWRSKYDGLRGALMAARSQWEETRGGMEEQLRSMKSELEVLRQQSTQLTAQHTTYQQQLETLPGLQERADLAEAMELQLSRMETIMRYPQIIGRTEVKQVGEDQHEERANPFMDMLLSSTVTGDEFTVMVEQIAGQLVVPAAEPVIPPVTGGGAPPPTPAPGEKTVESLLKLAMDAQKEGDYAEANKLYDEVSLMRTKKT